MLDEGASDAEAVVARIDPDVLQHRAPLAFLQLADADHFVIDCGDEGAVLVDVRGGDGELAVPGCEPLGGITPVRFGAAREVGRAIRIGRRRTTDLDSHEPCYSSWQCQDCAAGFSHAP